MIATHFVNNTASAAVQFQRPLCPYPERGEYIGHGDPNNASSFQCVKHEDDFDPRNIGRQVAYENASDHPESPWDDVSQR